MSDWQLGFGATVFLLAGLMGALDLSEFGEEKIGRLFHRDVLLLIIVYYITSFYFIPSKYILSQ